MPGAAGGEAGRALAALYAGHGGALLRHAVHVTGGDVHSAGDVVQETMLRACRRPGSVAGLPVRAWLFTVAGHWAIGQHRARQARPAEVAGMAELTARAAPDRIGAAITGWDLAAAMAGLRAGDRRLLTARYLDDDSISKIAADLGVPAGTVKSRLSAARDALRRRLRSGAAWLPGRPGVGQMMSRRGVSGARCDALFVSPLQPSQEPGAQQVRHAVAAAARRFGEEGCAGRVAQEFGEHPEAAARADAMGAPGHRPGVRPGGIARAG